MISPADSQVRLITLVQLPSLTSVIPKEKWSIEFLDLD